MNLDLASLKEFLDLGGTFILALVLLWSNIRFFSNIDEKLTKVLALLAILTKSQTNFNGVEGILNKDGEKVAKMIIDSESKTS